jgi:hypothetical protein
MTLHRSINFENRVLQRIFGPKKKKVTGKCRPLDNDFIILFCQRKENKMGGECSVHGRDKIGIQKSGAISDGWRPL